MSKRATDIWTAAKVDGWTDLQPLKLYLDDEGRPDCAISTCGRPARFVDPSGVGVCEQHKDEGPGGVAPFVPPVRSRGASRR